MRRHHSRCSSADHHLETDGIGHDERLFAVGRTCACFLLLLGGADRALGRRGRSGASRMSSSVATNAENSTPKARSQARSSTTSSLRTPVSHLLT